MNKKLILVVTTSIGILGGCANHPLVLATTPQAELKSASTRGLCQAYRFLGQEKYLKELLARGEYTEKEIDLIRDSEVEIGMSEEALQCSWGKPARITTASDGRAQYVYKRSSYSRQLIYIKDGKISSWITI